MFPQRYSSSHHPSSGSRRREEPQRQHSPLTAYLRPVYLDFQTLSGGAAGARPQYADTFVSSGTRPSDSDSDDEATLLRPQNTRPESPSAVSSSPTASIGGSSSSSSSRRDGLFSDYDEYRQARREARWKLAQGALLVAGCVAAGVLAVVCPPIVAAGAALATGTGSLILSTVQKFFSLTSDLANNHSFLPRFKKDVKKLSRNFKNWVDTQVDPLRQNPRQQPHTEFLIRLSGTLEEFSKNIQDKDYQESMEAALAFERKMLDDMTGHVFSFGTNRDKQRIGTIQNFLRKYDKYLSKLPENPEELREVDRLRLEHIVKKARESGISALVEWSENPNNLATQLGRMQLRN